MLTDTQSLIHQVFCVLEHIENVSPDKIKDLAEYWTMVPVDSELPVVEVGGLLKAIYEKFASLHTNSFYSAKISGPYIRNALIETAELRLAYDTAQQTIAYHSRILDDLLEYLGNSYYKARLQQAIVRDDVKKIEYYSSKLSMVNASEASASTTALQVASGYTEKRALYGSGIKTGIGPLDESIDYMTYRSLNILMAPSANFKTTTACSIVYDAAIFQGKNVVYFTLEDFEDVIWYNIIARHSYELGETKIASSSLKKYKLCKEDEIQSLTSIAKDLDSKLNPGSITVYCKETCKDLTPAGIEAKILETANRLGTDVDMVVIDHFNLLNSPIRSMPWLTGSELQRYYVTSLTNLAITTGKRGFVLLGLAQVNREGQGVFEGGNIASSLHVAGTIELLWSATNFVYLYANEADRVNQNLQGKLIKSRFSDQGKQFVTGIIPAYCLVGKQPNAIVTPKPVEQSTQQQTQPSTPATQQGNALTELAYILGNQDSKAIDDIATEITGIETVDSTDKLKEISTPVKD